MKANFLGISAYQSYRVINLWEVDAELVFSQSLTTLLPFVPVLKGGAEEPIIRRALQVLRQDQCLSELETLLAFFARFMLDTELVAQIMRWDMQVLQESPWYQEILQQGERSVILRQLAHRLGELSDNLKSQIQSLSTVQLEALGEALLDFSNESDLLSWLETQVHN